MNRIALPILSMLVSSQANGGLKGIARLMPRGLEDALTDDTAGDNLEDGWNGNITGGNHEDAWNDDNITDPWSEAEPVSSSSINITNIQGMISSRAQHVKEVAEAQAWQFYQSSPSEWTESQWDFVLALFGGLLLMSCCCLSICCAYCCIHRGNDDDESTEGRFTKRMLHHRLRRHRSRYMEQKFNEPEDDSVTIESKSTFDSSSIEMTDTKKQALLTKSESLKSKQSAYPARETVGSYIGPRNEIITIESRPTRTVSPVSTFSVSTASRPQSPMSIVSTFDDTTDTPRKSNSKLRNSDPQEC